MFNLSKRQRDFGVSGKKLAPRCSYEATQQTVRGLHNRKLRLKSTACEIAAYCASDADFKKERRSYPLRHYSPRIRAQVLRAADNNNATAFEALQYHPRAIIRAAASDLVDYWNIVEASRRDYY